MVKLSTNINNSFTIFHFCIHLANIHHIHINFSITNSLSLTPSLSLSMSQILFSLSYCLSNCPFACSYLLPSFLPSHRPCTHCLQLIMWLSEVGREGGRQAGRFLRVCGRQAPFESEEQLCTHLAPGEVWLPLWSAALAASPPFLLPYLPTYLSLNMHTHM